MTLRTALEQGVALLNEAGVTNPRLTAEVLLAQALRQERIYLVAHATDELTELGWIHYGRYLHQRMQGIPTQYITKRQEFYGRPFRVEPAVLIPRPETELLVEAVLDRTSPDRRVLDVGAGSGCIGVTLALEKRLTVFATDISAAALAVAARNAKNLGAAIPLILTDLCEALPTASFDVVVTNPPYIPDGHRETLAPEVREHEPSLALFAGTDGLEIYRRLIPEAERVLRPDGLLAMEFGFGQAEAISEMLRGWRNVSILPDLAGIPRVALAWRSNLFSN